MARAHLYRAAADNQGNLLFNATVTVYEADYSVPLAQTMWTDNDGTTAIDNPFICTTGIIDFWLDMPQRVCILIQQQSVPDIIVYADANPAADEVVYADSPVHITNTPSNAGDVLLYTGTPGQFAWGAAPTGTGLTPIVTVVNDDFSSGGDPVGWTFSGAQVGTRSYDPTNLPPGTNYHYSMKFAGPTSTVQSQQFTFLDTGHVTFWLETELTASQSVVISLVDVSNVVTPQLTITDSRSWGFYAIPVAAGTWSVRISYTGTAGTPNAVWLTGFLAQYGGTVPAHNHQGSGSNSIALGTSATAFTNATAIGANASATGTNAVALGYGTQSSGTTSVAVGNGSNANANYAIAIGAGATGSNLTTAWTAIGQSASAAGNESIALGKSASASGDEGIAIGTSAAATATGAVAIGQGATSAATDGFAIGVGSSVGSGHTNSVALGAGAATTAANQVMLGTANSVATVPGSVTATGQVSLGTSSSRVGFYGSAGRTKPVVNGSDNGNVVLRTLISNLAAMGLITNNTVQQPVAFNVPVGNIDYFLRADNGLSNLGTADFDFQPYVYAPVVYAGTAPFASSPNWSITATHFAQKNVVTGLGVLKNAYNAKSSFTVQVQVPVTGSLANGDRFALITRHSGVTDGSSGAAYLVFDYQTLTLSLGVNTGSGVPSSYTVGGGNSIALSVAGGNIFDGSLHTVTVLTGGTDVGVQIDSSKPYYFKDATLNTTGTYVGWDTNSSTIGNILVSALMFSPTAIFDGFRGAVTNSTTMGNTDSGTAWQMVPAVGTSTVGISAGVLTLTSGATAANHIGCYFPTTVNTMGKTIRTTFTAVPTGVNAASGVLVSYVDPLNYVVVTPTIIAKMVAGTQTTLATHSSAIAANDLLTITISAAGLVTVFKNGSSVSSNTPSPTIPQNPNVGLLAYNPVTTAAVLTVGSFTVTDQFNATVFK